MARFVSWFWILAVRSFWWSSLAETDLFIGGFFPITHNLTEGSIGRGVIPAVSLALYHINSNPRILNGYSLKVYWNDTKCDPAVGMKTFFDMLFKEPPKVMLFGAACTAVTDPIAKASQFFQLVQVTYADTHPMYTSESYPNFFRVVPSESAFNPARVALLQRFNWTRVGTLYQNSPRYALPHSKLLTDLDMAKIDIAASFGFADELGNDLHRLKDNDVRIILGNFNESWARRIFCEAYNLGMYGRKYQWIIVSMYQQWWWKIPDQSVSCSVDQLEHVLEGYIGTEVLPLSLTSDITVSGLTASEYQVQYRRYSGGEYSRFHGYAYDGIWAIALAIQAVIRKLRTDGSSESLENFKYRNAKWGDLFREALNNISFHGVTGSVMFVKNERRGIILLKQFQNGNEVKIGEYSAIADYLDLSRDKPIVWRGGTGPPVDQTQIQLARTRVSITIYAILVTFAILGIILASVFLVINIKYRNQRYIKMSSPYLNNIIVIGCMLTYTSVILLGLDSGLTSETNFPYICAARAWVLMSGFTLAFGSMFSKTWRVHAIFTNIKLNKKVIKDYKLFMVVGVLVLIDVAILTTWQVVDPFYRMTSKSPPITSSENEDLVIIPEMEFCQSERMTIFLGCIYGYKGLLMAFGCFLAWETRHVNIPALNDSKYVGMSVYNVVIMCVIGAAVSFVLREQQDAAFIIISIFIIFCSTTTLCLVFVPKLLELWRNPLAGERRVRTTLKPLNKSHRSSEDSTFHCKVKLLQDENSLYKQKLEQHNVELQTLLKKLKDFEEPVIISHREHFKSSPLKCSSPIQEDSTLENENEDDTSPLYIKPKDIEYSRSPQAQKKQRRTTVSFKLPDESPEEDKRRFEVQEESSISQSPTDYTVISPLEQLRPSNLSESIGGAVNSLVESETSNESSPSHKSLSPREFEYPPESDDTSYARAIKNSQKRSMVNGLSSSCDEDTDRCDIGTLSEADSDSSHHYRMDPRRRAKSLGTLRLNTRPRSTGVSVIQNRRTEPMVFPPLISYFSHMVDERQSTHRRRTSETALYSSYPSIKCDIVEYL